MLSQGGQGRKLPHIVSIVAKLSITEVEGHYHNIHALRFYHAISGHLHVMKREGGAVLV